jgi:drug/metabolite transporter (DMT)-like permease
MTARCVTCTPTNPERRERRDDVDANRKSAYFVLVSSLAFASMAALIKSVSVSIPHEMTVFFRNFFGLVALTPLLFRENFEIRTKNTSWHLSRAVFGLTAMYCFFFALGRMPLADAVLLNYTAPIFTPIIALLMLREEVPTQVWWAIGVGFVGVVLILKPGHALFTPVAFVGLASGIFAAFAMTTIRRMSATEPTVRIVFYFALVGTLGSSLPLYWSWQSVDLALVFPLTAIGVLATIGQLFLTKAYTLAPAARVGSLTYTTVVFAALYGWLFWGEAPDWFTGLGALLVFVGGALAIGRIIPFPWRVPFG